MIDFDDNRPNPDELLASLKNEEEKSKRGKLKIFFGMCAGVGKTYTMLQAAQVEKKKGSDIVIGYVETHNRKETAKLVVGLEIIQRKIYDYKSTSVQEMDLDAIIARKPNIVLVDELAHTNATGSRHAKRYQDVQEILENGINVYTTLNVQHLESRFDTVAQITGIVVRETLPDKIFETADEIEIVDISPDELLIRLSEGNVYAPERSKEAIENFFRKGNITALREMALRIVADKVDKQLYDYMQDKHIKGPWKSGLHLLVAIGPSPNSARLVRWAKNLSYTMGASLTSLYIQSGQPLSESQNDQLSKNIELAKKLGSEVITTSGTDLVKEILTVAQRENISHIIVGKPWHHNILSVFKLNNFINKLVRFSGNIDVYILGSDQKLEKQDRKKFSFLTFTSGIPQYLIATFAVFFTASILYLFIDSFNYQIVSYILLFVVSLLAIFIGVGPILLASTLSALIWDYFFIPPKFTFHIDRTEDALMFVLFFIVALVNGVLTSRVRKQEKLARDKEERTNALFQLTKKLEQATSIDEAALAASENIKKYFNIEPIFIFQDGNNIFSKPKSESLKENISDNDFSIASWVYRHSQKAGKFTDTLPSSEYTIYPLKGNSVNLGVVLLKLKNPYSAENEMFWDTFLSQISGKIEREFLRNITKNAYLLNESDKLYKTLFNSISHELRIPVATVMGASDTLLSQSYPEETKLKLYSEINTASIRLNRLIENLLNMSRLESGRITLRADWCDVHDLANKITDNLKQELLPFNVSTVIPNDMPLVYIDFGLIEQVLHNLVLNATQNAPVGTTIRIKFFYDNNIFTIQVMDRGKGFPESELLSVFNKFYRGKDAIAGGTGLGLSIVKGFVEAHKGTVIAENRQNGGALFTIKIPVKISDINHIS